MDKSSFFTASGTETIYGAKAPAVALGSPWDLQEVTSGATNRDYTGG